MILFPPFGSIDYHTLPHADPRRVLADLVFHANCWRMLVASPYLGEVLEEWASLNQRRADGEASTAVSVFAREQTDRGHTHFSYAQIEERRKLVSHVPCDGCGATVTLTHPWLNPDYSRPAVLCESCAGRSAGAA